MALAIIAGSSRLFRGITDGISAACRHHLRLQRSAGIVSGRDEIRVSDVPQHDPSFQALVVGFVYVPYVAKPIRAQVLAPT